MTWRIHRPSGAMLYACRKVSMLTAFFTLCCVMSLKMTWRIRRPSGAMLYACRKVSMLTAVAEGAVVVVGFQYDYL